MYTNPNELVKVLTYCSNITVIAKPILCYNLSNYIDQQKKHILMSIRFRKNFVP